MKKINSIGYGHLALMWIFVLLIVIPFCFKLLLLFCCIELIKILMTISFCIGGIVFIGFIVLLFIEFCQDKILDEFYSNNTNIKILMNTGKYECQFCGNTNVKTDDKSCKICGTRFECKF